MFRISLKHFLAVIILIGAGTGMAIRICFSPFKVQYFFENGQVSCEWWEQRIIGGETERLWDLGTIHYFSNGVKSSEHYSGDMSLSRYYSPDGSLVSRDESQNYYLRDLGDGTFADSLPRGNGRPSPFAREYSERPTRGQSRK